MRSLRLWPPQFPLQSHQIDGFDLNVGTTQFAALSGEPPELGCAMSSLTVADANNLALDPSAENRELTAIKITELFKSKALDPTATNMVEEILRIFAHDAAIRVPKAVSQQLQHEPDLPKDVALALARDVDDVAVPVLRFSRALSDADLAELAASGGQAKLCALATRHQVGPVLSDALIDHGDEMTVATLLANAGSSPTKTGMMTVLDKFTDSDRVQAPLARRMDVPPAVLVRMITLVSDHVLQELSSRKDLPLDLAADIIAQAEERAFISLADEHADPAEMVAHLVQADRLSCNLAVRPARKSWRTSVPAPAKNRSLPSPPVKSSSSSSPASLSSPSPPLIVSVPAPPLIVSSPLSLSSPSRPNTSSSPARAFMRSASAVPVSVSPFAVPSMSAMKQFLMFVRICRIDC